MTQMSLLSVLLVPTWMPYGKLVPREEPDTGTYRKANGTRATSPEIETLRLPNGADPAGKILKVTSLILDSGLYLNIDVAGMISLTDF